MMQGELYGWFKYLDTLEEDILRVQGQIHQAEEPSCNWDLALSCYTEEAKLQTELDRVKQKIKDLDK